MKLARGEQVAMPDPRSRIRRKWLRSIDSRSASSLNFNSSGSRLQEESLMPEIWRLRHNSMSFEAVV